MSDCCSFARGFSSTCFSFFFAFLPIRIYTNIIVNLLCMAIWNKKISYRRQLSARLVNANEHRQNTHGVHRMSKGGRLLFCARLVSMVVVVAKVES